MLYTIYIFMNKPLAMAHWARPLNSPRKRKVRIPAATELSRQIR